MIFNLFKPKSGQRNAPASIDAIELDRKMRAGEVVLIDVREPHEFASESIPGARCMPLSVFRPDQVPSTGMPVVFQCLSGARSGRALALYRGAGQSGGLNLQGGINGWKAVGLPVKRG